MTMEERHRDATLLALEMRKGDCELECGYPLEAGKGKQMDSSGEPPERNGALLAPSL